MQKRSIKLGSDSIIFALLFLMAMEFFNRPYYVIIAAMLVFFLFRGKSVLLHRSMLPMALLTVSLLIFSPDTKERITGVIKPFCYLFCTVIGYNLMDGEDDQPQEKKFLKLIFLIAVGQFAHFLLNFLYNMNEAGDRNTIDIWSQSVKSATGQAALATMIVGVGVPVLFTKMKPWVKWAMLLCLAISIVYNFQLAGRTLFVMMAIALALCLLFKLLTKNKMRRKIQMLVALGVIVCVIVVLIANNTFGLQDKIVGSNFFNRFFGKKAYQDIGEDRRIEAKLQYLKMFWDYPFGGFHIQETLGVFAHDILLDTHDEAGVFAFVAVLWFLIVLIARSVQLLRNRQTSADTKMIFLSFLMVMLVEFMIEPILVGMQAQFMGFCVIYGALCKFTDNISVLPEGEICHADRPD